MFFIIYLVVWFAGSAMLARQGFWSNSIAFVNFVISGLVAFGFYAPLTIWIDEKTSGQYTYVLDFVVIWFLFAVSMVMMRGLTGALSKTRMRFKHPIDPIGSAVMGELASWVLALFVMATLHTAPMPKNAFGGGLVQPNDVETANALFTSPDAGWLRFVEKVSAVTALGYNSANQFKARAWVQIYQDHRAQFEKSDSIRVRRGA